MLRLQWLSSCCLGSNSTVKLWHPPPPACGLLSHIHVGGLGLRTAVFSWLVSFCTTVNAEAVSGWGSGWRCQHNSICPCCCQLWRKGSGAQGLIFSLGEMAGDCVGLTQMQFWIHRTSCPRPQLTLSTFYDSINVHSGGGVSQCLLKLNVDSLNAVFYQWHYATKLSHLCFCLTYKVAIPLSEPCPLFCRSCQKCQPYLLSFRPSWRLEEQEKEGDLSTNASFAQHISGE